MFLIKLTKLVYNKENPTEIWERRDWYVNPDHIATILETHKGTSIAVRGFSTNTFVNETPEEIYNAIQQAKSDSDKAFWSEQIASIERALLDGGNISRLLGSILHPPIIIGSGAVPDADSLRKKLKDL